MLRLQRTVGNRAVVVQRQEHSQPVPPAELGPAPAAAPAAPPTYAQAPMPGLSAVLTDKDRALFAREPKYVSFYERRHAVAIADQAVSGVPALVTLAQMVEESGWGGGMSGIHNLFGLKGNPDSPPDRIQWQWTREPVASRSDVRARYGKYPEFEDKDPKEGEETYPVKLPFRKFANDAESVAAHGRTLHDPPYAAAWSNSAAPVAFARAVAAAGYAAGNAEVRKRYGGRIVSIITTLDKVAAYVRERDPAHVIVDILNATPSSEGIRQARNRLPDVVPGYYVLSEDGRRDALVALRAKLVGYGVGPYIADEVCSP